MAGLDGSGGRKRGKASGLKDIQRHKIGAICRIGALILFICPGQTNTIHMLHAEYIFFNGFLQIPLQDA